MQARAVVSAAALGVGLALLVAAVAPARPASSSGGTFRVNLVGDVDYVDPALAYYTVSWAVEYATCLKLVNYPDAEAPAGSQLVPEAATALPAVSKDGRTYTFALRRGLRSNRGRELTAASFAWAINRALSPKMQSPGGAFVRDLVGAQDVLKGKVKTARGVTTPTRYTLRLTLTEPAGDLLARLAMPFLLRDRARPRDRAGGRRHARVVGAVLRRRAAPEPVAPAQAEPPLRRIAPARARRDRLPSRREPGLVAGRDRARCRRLRRRQPRAGRVREAGRAVRGQQAPVLRQAIARRAVPPSEPEPAALQGQPAARAGDQLRGRPAGAPASVRRVCGQADRPAAPVRHAGASATSTSTR